MERATAMARDRALLAFVVGAVAVGAAAGVAATFGLLGPVSSGQPSSLNDSFASLT